MEWCDSKITHIQHAKARIMFYCKLKNEPTFRFIPYNFILPEYTSVIFDEDNLPVKIKTTKISASEFRYLYKNLINEITT